MSVRPVPPHVVERAFKNRQRMGDCLESTYSVGSHGYAQIGWAEDGRTVGTLIHIVVWEFENGPVPDGMQVDHLCRNRRCSELSHLRLLMRSENASGNAQSIRTHCPKGHPYEGDNLYRRPNGHRECRICIRASNQRSRQRQKGRKF